MRIVVRKGEHTFDELKTRLVDHTILLKSDKRGFVVIDLTEGEAPAVIAMLDSEGFPSNKDIAYEHDGPPDQPSPG